MNVVALIAKRFETDVCSAYLLEPDRANLVLAATVGLRPQCIGTLRLALHEGLAGLGGGSRFVPWRSSRSRIIRGSSISARPARTIYQSFLGRSAHRPGRAAGRAGRADAASHDCFSKTKFACWRKPPRKSAPVVSEARTLDRFIAPAQERLWSLARNLWWSWDNDSTSLFLRSRSVPLAAAESQSDRAAVRNPARKDRTPRRRTGAARPNQLCLPPPARISGEGSHLGRAARGSFAAPSRGLFFGGVRPARIDPDLFRRLGSSGRRSHQERLGPGHSAGRHWAVLRPGIFPAASGQQRLAAGRLSSRPT